MPAEESVVFAPGNGGPLSLMKMISVSSSWPDSRSTSRIRPTPRSMRLIDCRYSAQSLRASSQSGRYGGKTTFFGSYFTSFGSFANGSLPVSYTHLRAHETPEHL